MPPTVPADPKDFEAAALEALSTRGTVTGEQQLGHKKVDGLLVTESLGKATRTAVECKSYSRKLHQEEVARIYAAYLPLVEAGLVHQVLIVTRLGLAPSATTMVEESPLLLHQTLGQLRRSIIDFSGYLHSLVDSWENETDGLPHYWIDLRTSSGALLEQEAREWLHQNSDRPLVILGGYGLGKTSFARRFAAQEAVAALNDGTGRIPVLIDLSDISDEQSLEGLLGKALTSTATLGNYSYPAFQMLNRSGQLLVMLDGFDEMRYALTSIQLRYNMRQLNRLVVPRSRVMMLGRPTFFLNEAEKEMLLHGVQNRAGTRLRDREWADWREVSIAPLSDDDIDAFVERYFSYRLGTDHNPKSAEGEIRSQKSRLKVAHLRDLARRPVQLKMLSEVLPQWTGRLESLDLAHLYDIFIGSMIERDTDKRARQDISVKKRRQFAGELSLWMWRRRGQMAVRAEEIPDALIRPYASDGRDLEATRRSLVVGCFLDRRLGDTLSFSHRSYQEFLVAEQLLQRLSRASSTGFVDELDRDLTDEVADFVAALAQRRDVDRLLDLLAPYRGTVSSRLARVVAWDPALIEERVTREDRALRSSSRRPDCPWWPALLSWRLAQPTDLRGDLQLNARALLGRLRRTAGRDESFDYALTIMASVLDFAASDPDSVDVLECLVVLLGGTARPTDGPASRGNRFGSIQRHRAQLRRLADAVAKGISGSHVNLHFFNRSLAAMLAEYCLVADDGDAKSVTRRWPTEFRERHGVAEVVRRLTQTRRT